LPLRAVAAKFWINVQPKVALSLPRHREELLWWNKAMNTTFVFGVFILPFYSLELILPFEITKRKHYLTVCNRIYT